MHVAISDAKGKLTDLVRRAEAGDEVILTRHGRPAVRLTPVLVEHSLAERQARRRAALEAFRGSAKRSFGPDAARSQDFLYDDYGLPA